MFLSNQDDFTTYSISSKEIMSILLSNKKPEYIVLDYTWVLLYLGLKSTNGQKVDVSEFIYILTND